MRRTEPETGRTIIDRKPHWYALYTQSRHEKKVAEKFLEQGIEHYLPFQKVLKLWSDRKKWVEEPVFKSYIFVHIGLKDYYRVLQTEGVAGFVRFGLFPEVIQDKIIENIRLVLSSDEKFEISEEKFEEGDEVQVIYGPLSGVYGRLIKVQGRHKLIINVEVLNRSIIVNVAKKHVKKVSAV
ncbi:MAG TPA: UpxY family transcription antiterminator [Bacteroidia bacterium]|nr:UpxY family transcription antiterminator [Bacteroidia bacterium]HRS58209.1 UpxY family transcription antiterminator [Bacteroidia bacterium]HRU68817.1 UpxY family transcription antiterminator [Bacteroidia bacterium]